MKKWFPLSLRVNEWRDTKKPEFNTEGTERRQLNTETQSMRDSQRDLVRGYEFVVAAIFPVIENCAFLHYFVRKAVQIDRNLARPHGLVVMSRWNCRNHLT